MIISDRNCCSERETGLLSALSDDHGLTATPKTATTEPPVQLPEKSQPTFDI
jgi:hypothetical protein